MLLPQVKPRQDNFSNNTFFSYNDLQKFLPIFFSQILWLLVIDFRFLTLDNKPHWNCLIIFSHSTSGTDQA